jgi:hypothetical protein
MKATDIMRSNNPPRACYAIAFAIQSEEPFHVVDLAYMLLRFQYYHVRDCDYQTFELISISYHSAPNGTYGLLLYNKNLRHAYRKAVHQVRKNPSTNKSSQYGYPISTWPLDVDTPTIRTAPRIAVLMSNVQ